MPTRKVAMVRLRMRDQNAGEQLKMCEGKLSDKQGHGSDEIGAMVP